MKSRTIFTLNYVMADHEAAHLEEDSYISSFTLFDENGHSIQEEQRDPDGMLLECYHRGYTDSGDLKDERYETGEDGHVSSRSFSYNTEGKLEQERGEYAQGGTELIHYHYDEDGNLISRICLDDEDEEEFKEEYRYKNGHLTQETRWEYGEKVFQRTVEYDASHLVLSSLEQNFHDGSKREKIFTYDAEGRVSTESEFMDGKILTRKTYGYDTDNRIISILEEEAFRRDQVVFHYDDQGNLLEQEEKDGQGNSLQRITRTYNESSELVRTDVFVSGLRTGYSRRYALKYEYAYYPQLG